MYDAIPFRIVLTRMWHLATVLSRIKNHDLSTSLTTCLIKDRWRRSVVVSAANFNEKRWRGASADYTQEPWIFNIRTSVVVEQPSRILWCQVKDASPSSYSILMEIPILLTCGNALWDDDCHYLSERSEVLLLVHFCIPLFLVALEIQN